MSEENFKANLARRVRQTIEAKTEVVLASGQPAPIYFDSYRLLAHPPLFKTVVLSLVSHLPNDLTAIAGVELGGVPAALLLADTLGLPAAIVRKQQKPHGLKRWVEGVDLRGQRYVLVEDVTTTGESVGKAISQLRSQLVDDPIMVVALVDRKMGAKEKLNQIGIPFFSVLEFST